MYDTELKTKDGKTIKEQLKSLYELKKLIIEYQENYDSLFVKWEEDNERHKR